MRFALPLAVSLVAFSASPASTQLPDGWRPSEWGEGDVRGALNRLTSATTLAALDVVTEGVTYDLSHPLEAGMPAVAGRDFALTIGGGGPNGENQVVYHDDHIVSDFGHVGTHLDALGHVGTRVDGRDIYFNGRDAADFRTDTGLTQLSIDQVGPIVTRGVLLDVAEQKGAPRLDPGYVITPDDLEAAARSAGVEIGHGDAVLIRTGYGALWMTDNSTYATNYPGVGREAVLWLAERGATVVGSDNLGVNVSRETPGQVWELHQLFIAHYGIYLLENANLEELSRDGVHEFAFVFLPLKIKGGTGSPGMPIAIR